MIFNPLTLLVGLVLEAALGWWRFRTAAVRPAHPYARRRTDARSCRGASIVIHSLREGD